MKPCSRRCSSPMLTRLTPTSAVRHRRARQPTHPSGECAVEHTRESSPRPAYPYAAPKLTAASRRPAREPRRSTRRLAQRASGCTPRCARPRPYTTGNSAHDVSRETPLTRARRKDRRARLSAHARTSALRSTVTICQQSVWVSVLAEPGSDHDPLSAQTVLARNTAGEVKKASGRQPGQRE